MGTHFHPWNIRLSMPPLIEETPAAVRMGYRVGHGEQGVLSFEPYKSHILPLWRFKTVPIAKKSSENLWEKFIEFDEQGDFVGMDMTRKFIQMGFVSCHHARPSRPPTDQLLQDSSQEVR